MSSQVNIPVNSRYLVEEYSFFGNTYYVMTITSKELTLTEVSRKDKEPALNLRMADLVGVTVIDNTKEIEVAFVDAASSTAWNALTAKKRQEIATKGLQTDMVSIYRKRYLCNEHQRLVCELMAYLYTPPFVVLPGRAIQSRLHQVVDPTTHECQTYSSRQQTADGVKVKPFDVSASQFISTINFETRPIFKEECTIIVDKEVMIREGQIKLWTTAIELIGPELAVQSQPGQFTFKMASSEVATPSDVKSPGKIKEKEITELVQFDDENEQIDTTLVKPQQLPEVNINSINLRIQAEEEEEKEVIESVLTKSQQKQKDDREPKEKRFYQLIYLTDLETVCKKTDKQFVIQCKDKREFWVNVNGQFLALLQKEAQKSLGLKLNVKELSQPKNQVGAGLVPSNQNCLSIDVSSRSYDGNFRKMKIELKEKYIFEVYQDSVRRKCHLLDLDTIIVDKSRDTHLLLKFDYSFYDDQDKRNAENVTFELQFDDFESRDRLLSCMLTLRGLFEKKELDRLKIFYNDELDAALKIRGYTSPKDDKFDKWLANEYETRLIMKLEQNDSEELIDEILTNATFVYLQYSELPTKQIFQTFHAILKEYLRYEMQSSDVVENYLRSFKLQPFYPVRYFTRENGEPIPDEAKFEACLRKAIKWLNLMRILLNSKFFFAEVAHFPQLLFDLTKLLMSQNSAVALLASLVLKASIQHVSDSDKTAELANKKLLTGIAEPSEESDKAIQQGLPDVQEKFFDQIIDFLTHFADKCVKPSSPGKDQLSSLEQMDRSIKSLHLDSILQVVLAVLDTRRKRSILNTFLNSEVQIFVEKLTLQVIQPLICADNSEQENCHLPFLQLIEKFSLVRAEFVQSFDDLDTDGFFDVRLLFSQILFEMLDWSYEHKELQTKPFEKLQTYILNNSVQFIWHLHQQMNTKFTQQKEYSGKIIQRLLYKNRHSIELMTRLFPITLFTKVEQGDIVNRYTGCINPEWSVRIWNEFLDQIRKDFDNPQEHWTTETRTELLDKLQAEIQSFLKTQTRHMVAKSGQELVEACHYFDLSGKVCSNREDNIRWNHQEFSIQYDCLRPYYKVGNYYLKKLLPKEEWVNDQKPKFSQKEKISDTRLFLDQLVCQFIASDDDWGGDSHQHLSEHEYIIMAVCLLYKDHYEQIGALKSLPFWLQTINRTNHNNCRFLLLQLVHIALSIDRKKESNERTAKKNLKKFVKAGGYQILLERMKDVVKHNNNQNDPQYKDGEAEKGFTNFTNSKTNDRYFSKNNHHICMGILSLKILDLIFRQLQFNDHLPLPSNRKFIYEKQSMNTLTQMLKIDNHDLKREVLIFIETHLNTHYAFSILRNTGIIELLILCLSTRNGDRALALLLKFQEVCIDFNEQIKLSKFNKNDLKMIQEDKNNAQAQENDDKVKENAQFFAFFDHELNKRAKRFPTLSDSIFLKYLPVPFIKYLYEKHEKPDKDFLEVYRTEDKFCSPILIWTKSMREGLEEQIQGNLKTRPPGQDNRLEDYKMVTEIVEFGEIYEKTRCGRYYLDEWVKEGCNYKIPVDEQDEFHNKMQAELRYFIYEEKFGAPKEDDQKNAQIEEKRAHAKVLTLFKSCLKALKEFKKKRITSLNEIRKILLHTCGLFNEGQQTEKQIEEKERLFSKDLILIGMEIIHEAIHINDKNNETIHKAENITELLKMNGFEFVAQIGGFILKHAPRQNKFKYPQDMSTIKEKDNEDCSLTFNEGSRLAQTSLNEGQSSSKIDIKDAKILHLCIQTIQFLVIEDIQQFLEVPLDDRIKIFFQMTQMLDLSLSYFELFKEKERTKEEGQNFPETSSFRNKTHTLLRDGTRDSSDKQKKDKERPKRKKRRKNEDELKKEYRETESNLLSKDPTYEQLSYQQQPVIELENNMQGRRISVRESRPAVMTVNQFDFQTFMIIFDTSKTVFQFSKQLSCYPVLHPDLIASGLAWQAFMHAYLYYTDFRVDFHKQQIPASFDTKINQLKSQICQDLSETLVMLVSFARRFFQQGPETFSLKELTRDKEKGILEVFNQCIDKMFTQKFQDKFVRDCIITNENKLSFVTGQNNQQEQNIVQDLAKKLLVIFSSEIKEAELVWNTETRKELKQALQNQLTKLQSFINVQDKDEEQQHWKEIKENFGEIINSQLKYAVTDTELLVYKIFVCNFNENYRDEMELEKKQAFASALIEELGKFEQDNQPKDEDEAQKRREKTKQLLTAYKNLIVHLNYKIPEENVFEDHIKTLSKLIRVPSDKKSEIFQEQNVKELADLVLQIISHIIKENNNDVQPFEALLKNGYQMKGEALLQPKKPKTMCEMLLSSHEFFKLMIKVLFQDEIFRMIEFDTQFMVIIESMIEKKVDGTQRIKPELLSQFFINKGVILFLLEMFFDPDLKRKQAASDYYQNTRRCTLLVYLLRIEEINQDETLPNGVLYAFIPSNFLAEIKDYLKRNPQQMPSNENDDYDENIQRFITNIVDDDKFDNVFVKWNKDTREQSKREIRILCEEIFNNKEDKDKRLTQEIIKKIEVRQAFKKNIEKEVKVDEIILRIYNQNPCVFINQNLTKFIIDVAEETHNVYEKLFDLKNMAVGDAKKQNEINQLHKAERKYFIYKAKVLLSTLMLSLEQLQNNDTNPNNRTKTLGQILLALKSDKVSNIDTALMPKIKMWLQSTIFLDTKSKDQDQSLRIIFLQMLYQAIEMEKVFFVQNEWNLQFIRDAIDKMITEEQQQSEDVISLCEYKLILMIVHKMIRAAFYSSSDKAKKELQFLKDGIFRPATLEKLTSICDKKKEQRNKQYNLFDHAKCLLEYLRIDQTEENLKSDTRHDSVEYKNLSAKNFEIRQKWRIQPVHQSQSEIKRIETGISLEEFQKETFKFPILSVKSTEEDTDQLYENYKQEVDIKKKRESDDKKESMEVDAGNQSEEDDDQEEK